MACCSLHDVFYECMKMRFQCGIIVLVSASYMYIHVTHVIRNYLYLVALAVENNLEIQHLYPLLDKSDSILANVKHKL